MPFCSAWSTTTSTNGLPVSASTCDSTSAVISIRYESRRPRFQVRKISAISAGEYPATSRSSWYASPMSCMSAYSMPLCTIVTKCPAPSGPTWETHGEPSAAFAEIFSSIGPSES